LILAILVAGLFHFVAYFSLNDLLAGGRSRESFSVYNLPFCFSFVLALRYLLNTSSQISSFNSEVVRKFMTTLHSN
jgi:hypothetical protein